MSLIYRYSSAKLLRSWTTKRKHPVRWFRATKKETVLAWFMVQENSAITIAILCSMGGSVRVPSEQSQWPTAAVVIKHDPEARSSAQMFSFWCWDSKKFVQSSKEATHDRLHPSYLYYSPSRQLSMCWLSTHARWEWIALLFTLTITWKIGDMLSKGIHPARFRLQLAFCAVAKEQLNHMWACSEQKRDACSVQTPRMRESGWRE